MPDVYALPRVAEYVLREDWAGVNDGTFDGPLDDVSAYLIDAVGIERGRDQGRVTGGPKTPTLRATLDNESGIFATERVDSPLYGQLGPGKRCQFGMVLGSDVAVDDELVWVDDPEALIDGTSEALLFSGRTAEPAERYGLGDFKVDVSAYGLMNRLINNEITIVYQATITTGAAMVLVYQAAGLGVDEYVVDPEAIDNGRTLRDWYVEKRSAFEVAREVWATEGPPAAHFERADGRLEFQGRSYRSFAEASLVVQQSFLDLELSRDSAAVDSEIVMVDDPNVFVNGETTALWHTAIGYEPSYGSVVNSMAIEVEQREADVVQEVWKAPAPITLSAGETRELFATASTGDPLTGIVTPALTTDYTIGSGGLASVTAVALGGLTVKITLVAGGSGAVVNPPAGGTGIRLRAQPVKVIATTTVGPVVDPSDSRAEFGIRGLPQGLTVWRGLSEADAAGLCDAYLIAYPRPRALVIVTIENATGPLLLECARREIGDLIHAVHARSGIDLDATVEQVNHAISAGGRHATVLTCERNVRLDWARYDVSLYDDPAALYGQ